MAARIQYEIVGRYMDGKEVTGYFLQSMDSTKSGKYSREQVAYLVGRGQVVNCEGQIYKDKLLLRGVGISLDSLPVQQENGELSRTENIGKVRKGTSTADAMTQLMIVESIKNGRETVGYVVRSSGGVQKNLSRADVIKLASSGKIGNARVQNYNGNVMLRGVNVCLDELPVRNIKQEGASNTTKTNRSETTQNSTYTKSSGISPESKARRRAYVDARANGRQRDVFNSTAMFKSMISHRTSYNMHRLVDESPDIINVIKLVGNRFSEVISANIDESSCVVVENRGGSRKYSAYIPFRYFKYASETDNVILNGVIRVDSNSFAPSNTSVIDISIGKNNIVTNGVFNSETADTNELDNIMQKVKTSLSRSCA